MKKIFATLALAVAAIAGTTSTANAADGNWFVGGSVGFYHYDSNSSSYNQFVIKPEAGYNFNSTWTFGATVGYEYINFFRAHETWRGDVTISPYARYTFFRQGILQLFVDGGVDFGVGVAKSGGGEDKAALTYGIGFKPGIALNFTKKFSMVAHVGFLGYRGCNDAAYNTGGYRMGGIFLDGNAVSLGAYFNF